MFERLKYSRLGNSLRPIWHAVKRPFVGRNVDQRRVCWENLQRLLATDPVLDLPIFKGQFQIGASSHLFLRLMADGEYETDLAELVNRHLDRNRDAIDIGGNIGFFCCLMTKQLQGGRVLVAEPTPGAHRRLLANIHRNEIADRVVVFQGAVSSSRGEIEMAIVEGKEEFSSIGQIGHPSVVQSNVQSLRVPTQTLDELVVEHQLNPGFIKIDVEGAEGFVFAGAQETLRKHRPVILSELSDPLLQQKGFRAQQIIDDLRQLNYRVIDPVQENLDAGTRPYGDILALPQ